MSAPNGLDPNYKAERTLIGVGIEGEQKTEVVPERLPGFTTGSQSPPGMEIDWQERRPVGAGREPQTYDEGQRSFEGASWTLYPYDGFPFAFLMGNENVEPDTPEAGITRHTLTPKENGPPPTATMEWTFLSGGDPNASDPQDNVVIPYVGVFPTDGSVTAANDDRLELDLSYNALGVTDDAPRKTYTDVLPLPTREPWKFQDSSTLSLFGTDFARVTEWSLDIDTGNEAEWYLADSGGGEPFEATTGMVEYEQSATIRVSDAQLLKEMTNPTMDGFSSNIVFSKQDTPKAKLKFNGYGCRLQESPHDIPEDGPVEVDVTILSDGFDIVVEDPQSGGTPYLESASTP